MEAEIFIKGGKALPIGTKRKHGGIDVEKTAQGWKPVKKEGGSTTSGDGYKETKERDRGQNWVNHDHKSGHRIQVTETTDNKHSVSSYSLKHSEGRVDKEGLSKEEAHRQVVEMKKSPPKDKRTTGQKNKQQSDHLKFQVDAHKRSMERYKDDPKQSAFHKKHMDAAQKKLDSGGGKISKFTGELNINTLVRNIRKLSKEYDDGVQMNALDLNSSQFLGIITTTTRESIRVVSKLDSEKEIKELFNKKFGDAVEVYDYNDSESNHAFKVKIISEDKSGNISSLKDARKILSEHGLKSQDIWRAYNDKRANGRRYKFVITGDAGDKPIDKKIAKKMGDGLKAAGATEITITPRIISFDIKNDSVKKAFDILKGRNMPIGTISNGRKKIAEGKWIDAPYSNLRGTGKTGTDKAAKNVGKIKTAIDVHTRRIKTLKENAQGASNFSGWYNCK